VLEDLDGDREVGGNDAVEGEHGHGVHEATLGLSGRVGENPLKHGILATPPRAR
jgi:hypothetical protein